VPVPQQLPQIAILPTWQPDPAKNDLLSLIAESAAHTGDPSSACVLAWRGPPLPNVALFAVPRTVAHYHY
jgi:hypothetical protein